jgi:Tol biopolymer transport system component
MVRTSWVTRVRLAILTTALMTVGLVSPAQAQYFGQNKVQYDKFDFKVLKTAHFDIYYYPAEASAAQAVARMSERWYTRLSGLFAHQLNGRQPVVLYASHPEFEQTNVIEGSIDEGTGGVTEGARRRVVLPLAATLGETDHVLGHELVHAFQYDILGQNVSGAPLWFIEGMAEYVSLGPRHAQTAIWLRDAAREDKLPTIKDLDNPQYFPYRFGHAFWAYIGGRWGDGTIGRILNSLSPPDQGVVAGGIDPIGAIEAATNTKEDQLSKDWQRAIRAEYDVSAEPSKTFPAEGNLNVGPSLSPDGSKIAFLSERSRLSIDLYIADAATGKVLHKLTKGVTDPHFQSLQFLASAGSWDPSGNRLAVATVRNGRAVIALFDTNKGDVVQEIPFEPRGEVFQPAFSPDGNSIAFSAQVGGVTDIYVYDFNTKQTKQLTKDNFADLQPAWSSDGQRIAFVTDRYSSNLPNLAFGNYGLAEVNLASGVLSKIDVGLSGNTVDPQFTRDGKSMFFINDATGRPDVYRMSTSGGAPLRLTSSVTGVSGITPLSPALSIASAGTRGAITVFRARGYQTQFLDDVTQGGLAVAPSNIDLALLPPGKRPPSTILAALQAPNIGLPPEQTYEETEYSPKFELIDVSQQVGVATGGGFGTYVSGGISFLFSDTLGNHLLNTVFDVQGGVKGHWRTGDVHQPRTPLELGPVRRARPALQRQRQRRLHERERPDGVRRTDRHSSVRRSIRAVPSSRTRSAARRDSNSARRPTTSPLIANCGRASTIRFRGRCWPRPRTTRSWPAR